MSQKKTVSKKQNTGCGCGSIPFSVMLLFLGLGYWGFKNLDKVNIRAHLQAHLPEAIAQHLPDSASPNANSTPGPIQPAPSPELTPVPTPVTLPEAPAESSNEPVALPQTPTPKSPTTPVATLPAAWESKQIRGIYLSRYQATNRASEEMIRDRVRYYKSQGINTLIHGVWGNGCTMYKSEVMRETLGFSSCPNEFQAPWLDWLIDEAHKQGMEVHAYFEKGIKLDRNSPIFATATTRGWLVPGIDKTYPGVDHYLLDVSNPQVAKYFTDISAEFVQKYPKIDAVQWDDYVGYHDELPGEGDRTAQLTAFMQRLQAAVKQANSNVSFDLCHHNPYWGKRYFDADWANWNADRAFIQAYNDANFAEEMVYAESYEGIAISDTQFDRLEALANNSKVKSVLLFPTAGKPEETAARFYQLIEGAN